MKEIKLSMGKVALVDDADYERLSRWRWLAAKRGRYKIMFYAVRRQRLSSGKWRSVLMHRQLAAYMGHDRVDHKDSDGLNNQRGNFRPCDQSKNNMNNRVRANKLSRFKGVSLKKRDNKWTARCCNKYLGVFEREEDAAMAYDAAALAVSPEFARVNFPQGG